MALLLHGLGADEQDLFGLAPWLDPRLAGRLGPRPARGPADGLLLVRHRLDRGRRRASTSSSVVESRGAILRFVEEAAEAYGADPSRVWLVGFSQGASMADGLRALAPGAAPRHRGPLRPHHPACGPGAPRPGPGRDSRCSGSTAGPTRWCRWPSATRPATLLGGLGLRVDYREYPIGHEISEESLRDLVRLADPPGRRSRRPADVHALRAGTAVPSSPARRASVVPESGIPAFCP